MEVVEKNEDKPVEEIKIKYFTDLEPIKSAHTGEWVDLRAADSFELKKGEFKLIPLGVEGYEAIVAPRSSTFKNFKIIQVNSTGVVDNKYCGDNDQWFMPVLAIENTVIKKNDRICQFRIQECNPIINFIEVDHLGNEDRGGHGSTGVN